MVAEFGAGIFPLPQDRGEAAVVETGAAARLVDKTAEGDACVAEGLEEAPGEGGQVARARLEGVAAPGQVVDGDGDLPVSRGQGQGDEEDEESPHRPRVS